MDHDAAKAGKAAAAAPVEHHVHVGAAAVQGEKVDHAEGVAEILLAEHIAVHAEDTHVAVLQRIVVDVDHRAVGDEGGHGVALYADGQLRAGGHITGDGEQVVILAEHRGGKARGGGGGVDGDGAGVGGGGGLADLVGHDGEGV